jgi:GntR family transcriptional regulator
MESIILDDLVQAITEGRYLEEEQLPSENELAQHYQIPRIMVRNAYIKLEDMGYIYSKQGKGRFLKKKRKQIELVLTGRTSFTEKMKNLGYPLETKNLYCEPIHYHADIYERLQIDKKETVYKIGRVRILDGEPIALHISYLSSTQFPNIEKDGSSITSIFDYYRNCGFSEFGSTKSVLSISFPTTTQREILQCNALVPLLIIETDCFDKRTDKVLEFTRVLYRSDSFTYDITAD